MIQSEQDFERGARVPQAERDWVYRDHTFTKLTLREEHQWTSKDSAPSIWVNSTT